MSAAGSSTVLVLAVAAAVALVACSAPRGLPGGATNTGASAEDEGRPFARIHTAFGAEVVSESSPASLRAQAAAVDRTLDQEASALVLPSEPEAIAEWLQGVAEWHANLSRAAETRADVERCRGCDADERAVYVALVALEHDHLLRGLLEPPVQGGGGMADQARGPIHATLARSVGRFSPGSVEATVERLAACAGVAAEAPGEHARQLAAWCAERQARWQAQLQAAQAAVDPVTAAAGPRPDGPAECWTPAAEIPPEVPAAETSEEPRAVVLWYTGVPRWIGPFDAREQERVRDAVHRWLAERVDVPIVDLRTVRRWEQRIARGQGLAAPACAAPPASQEQAIYDLEPAAWLFEIAPRISDEGALLEVRSFWGSASPPDALKQTFRAAIDGPVGDVSSWVDAVDRLEGVPREQGALAAVLGPSPAELRVAGVRVFGAEDAEEDAAVAAFTEAVAAQSEPVGACAPSDQRLIAEVALGIGRNGRPRFVRAQTWTGGDRAVEGCLERALRAVRLPASEARDRRVTATLEKGRAEDGSGDPRNVWGDLHGEVRVRLRQFDSPSPRLARAWDAERATEAALAGCLGHVAEDDRRVRRVTGEVRVSETGRVDEVQLEGADEEMLACARRALEELAFPCPERRTPSRVALDACVFRDLPQVAADD